LAVFFIPEMAHPPIQGFDLEELGIQAGTKIVWGICWIPLAPQLRAFNRETWAEPVSERRFVQWSIGNFRRRGDLCFPNFSVRRSGRSCS
jgi:hypothetical protein